MREIEAKILEVNVPAVEKKLLSLGAKKVFDGKISALFFDSHDNSLSKKSCILRLRKKGNLCELAFKQKLSSAKKAKIAQETETQVGSFAETRKLLRCLGFKEIKRLNKHRKSYCLGKTRFEFDKLPGIPAFLEIEAKSVKQLEKAICLLGFSLREARPWSAREVLQHYKKH